jgi:hypothetical protein
MDKKMRQQIINTGTDHDIERIYALSANGAMSWINLPYNYKWSIEFPNRIFIVAKSLILGNKLFNENNNKCNRCDDKMDLFGHHALHCPDGGNVIKRHDKICDFLFEYIKKRWPDAKKEQRYELIEMINGKPEKIRITDRPGDIWIPNWLFITLDIGPIYLDITIGNNFNKSNINDAKSGIGKLAQVLENKKGKKYRNKDDISGLGMEVFGAQSESFKFVLHQISKQLANMSVLSNTEWLHRIRSKMIGYLMFENCMMIIESTKGITPDDFQNYHNNVLEIVDQF